jgi:hypothetical protein
MSPRRLMYPLALVAVLAAACTGSGTTIHGQLVGVDDAPIPGGTSYLVIMGNGGLEDFWDDDLGRIGSDGRFAFTVDYPLARETWLSISVAPNSGPSIEIRLDLGDLDRTPVDLDAGIWPVWEPAPHSRWTDGNLIVEWADPAALVASPVLQLRLPGGGDSLTTGQEPVRGSSIEIDGRHIEDFAATADLELVATGLVDTPAGSELRLVPDSIEIAPGEQLSVARGAPCRVDRGDGLELIDPCPLTDGDPTCGGDRLDCLHDLRWFEVDLGAARELRYLSVRGEPNDIGLVTLRDLELEISSDGETYSPLGSVSYPRPTRFGIPCAALALPVPRTARYVRLRPDNPHRGIAEVSLF